MVRPSRISPRPGQESAWDYPRPPVVEPDSRRVQIWLGAVLIADSRRAQRVMETYHPPSWYIPADDIFRPALQPSRVTSHCEWKGSATYFDVGVTDQVSKGSAWVYLDPKPAFVSIASHVAFYPREFRCTVDGELVEAQPGGFYGGWITGDITGPFKGSIGMDGW
ncbi:MAG: hypothetical protein ACI9C1_001177 [Candidatus Aldehydirespiratoraceae bacterium]|jgi:uncharacterized protein (DUF427 family)